VAEQRDLSLRAVAAFAASLAVTIVVVLSVSKVIINWMTQRHTAEQALPLPVATPYQLPPEPRLQVHAPADLREWRAKEEAQLSSYGWVDRDAGVVHIPITDAMKLIEERGVQATNLEGVSR
jgi:hypothetical protein